VLALAGVLTLTALGTAVGLALAPVNLLYRDISRLLTVATAFWLVFSPVYFPPPQGNLIGAVMRANPVTPILSGTRSLLLTGHIADPVHTAVVSAGAFVALVLSWFFVRIVLRVAIEQANE
jgi:ABC-type polysaccharide/polyol phosphate export permease